MFKNKKYQLVALFWTLGLLGSLLVFLSFQSSIFSRWDDQILDIFFQRSIEKGHGSKTSSEIIFITVTDETIGYFGTNDFDRQMFAEVNNALATLNPKAVAYDYIFQHSTNPESDEAFKNSLIKQGRVYLPMGLKLNESDKIRKKSANSDLELLIKYIQSPKENGSGNPLVGELALIQKTAFFNAVFNTGNISLKADPDGTFRRLPLIVKVGEGFIPTLSLSLFLDYVQVSMKQIIVNWDQQSIIIPAKETALLKEDVVIPIDSKGQTFVPFSQFWESKENNFPQVPLHQFIIYFEDPSLRSQLKDLFQGKLVLVGDASQFSSDIGSTSLEDQVPLIAVHASTLNGMLNRSFYRNWTFSETIFFIIVIGIVLGLSALPKSSWSIYLTGIALAFGLIGFTWQQMVSYNLFPIFTVFCGHLFIFLGLVLGQQLAVSKERAFINRAFSKYLSPVFVDELVKRPELLQSGGENRVMTLFFSDMVGFTSISEKMVPEEIAKFMNEYLTEMTTFVLEEFGTVNQYGGDSIMASFGAPIIVEDHADRAVSAGLKMFRQLDQLKEKWDRWGVGSVKCRVGINTGLIFFGNLGSDQVFYYSALGDPVNLAARLESANKQYGTELLIAENTLEHLTPGKFRTRIIDIVKVKGKSKAVKIYEVIGWASDPIEDRLGKYLKSYQEGFDAYLQQDFSLARKKFNVALTWKAYDPASLKMIERIQLLNAKGLSADWDGSFSLSSK
jgi:adenylate cyclase